MKSREKGNVNIFLGILIIIVCVAIGYMLINSGESENVNVATNFTTERETVTRNLNTTTPTAKAETNVELSSDILNGGSSSNQSTSTTSTGEGYYYKQLTSEGKRMYNLISSNINALKLGTGSINFDINEANLDQYFQSTWDAISLDKPELFYVSTENISLLTRTTSSIFGKVTYSYILQPQSGTTYFKKAWNSENEVSTAIQQVDNKVNQIVSQAPQTNRYDKIKYAHDYLINNMEYNQQDAVNNGDVYGALIKGTAVCEGYAKAFQLLMNKLNVPSVIVFGKGVDDQGNEEFHAWNYVQMEDGTWYAVDTTWDDPIVIGKGKIPDSTKTRYFLKGSNDFFKQHTEDPDVSGTGQKFVYPTLSTTNYR